MNLRRCIIVLVKSKANYIEICFNSKWREGKFYQFIVVPKTCVGLHKRVLRIFEINGNKALKYSYRVLHAQTI